jgi:hypothetical protein
MVVVIGFAALYVPAIRALEEGPSQISAAVVAVN